MARHDKIQPMHILSTVVVGVTKAIRLKKKTTWSDHVAL